MQERFSERVRLAIAAIAARLAAGLVRSLGRGAASVLPGSVARRVQPRSLALLSRQVRRGVILVAGTNGKTTTALLLRSMFERQGDRVTHNATGANLENGLTAALLADADWFGRLRSDVAILEVDENVLPKVLPQIRPRLLLALNLFRDQLDRYGEVDTISQRWQTAIAPIDQTLVVVNADDPTLADLGQRLAEAWPPGDRVHYFGLTEPASYLDAIPHAVDSIYCPRCGHSLTYAGVYLSHQGDYHCPACGFAKPPPELHSPDWPQVLVGLYNKYNTLAAATTALTLGVSEAVLRGAIAEFRAAFGRAEELVVQGKQVRILLSKNPVGTNETIRAVLDLTRADPVPPTVLLALNDRTPDGTDVSWIWDVDMEPLVARGGTFVVTGDRAGDMALRLTYGRTDPSDTRADIRLVWDLPKAIAAALAATPPDAVLHILPTYSAMLEIRQILTGRGIL
jgi:UDP-N-acetylmuramyl tripeptide synthase